MLAIHNITEKLDMSMTAEPMDDAEIEKHLREIGTGVLSLTDGSETYAVPESFGYDGEDLYFQLVLHEASRKQSFIETTDIASVTVYAEQPARSIVVRGDLERLPDEEAHMATAALAENAVIPTLNVIPDAPVAELTFAYYRLTPREITGRKFGAQDRMAEAGP